MSNRWWIYQRERFPVFAHGPLIAAFSFSAVCFSSLLRGSVELPAAGSALVAFATAFTFFLQLRIADEFKDFADDSRYRPYRPVPRGLVKLRELGVVGVAGALLQFGLAWWLQPRLLVLLAITWAYLALMTREFFAPEWLKARPFTYMWTHMLIMPQIDFYATGCDWMAAGLRWPPPGLFWFLTASFFNGMVIELGRKIRAPQDEETGVQTYSAVWGRRRAVGAWLTAMSLTALTALMAARRIQFMPQVGGVLGVSLLGAVIVARTFLMQPTTKRAKRIENISGVWTLLLYLSIGAWPLLARWASR
jgi:4-hydroxybenzoate polyprenyltransferase